MYKGSKFSVISFKQYGDIKYKIAQSKGFVNLNKTLCRHKMA